MQTFGQYPKPRKNKKKQKKTMFQRSLGGPHAEKPKKPRENQKKQKKQKKQFSRGLWDEGVPPKESQNIVFFVFFVFLVFSSFFWFSVWELPKESLNIVFCVFCFFLFFFVFLGSFLVFFCMNKLIIFPRTKTIEFLVVSNEFYILNYLYTYSGHTYPPSESEYAKIVSLYCKYQ